jgi:hypothetical protein
MPAKMDRNASEDDRLWGEWEEASETLENEDAWATVFHAAVAQGQSAAFLNFQDVCLERAAQEVHGRATALLNGLGKYAMKTLQARGYKVSGFKVALDGRRAETERTVLSDADFATMAIDLSSGSIVGPTVPIKYVGVTVYEVRDDDPGDAAAAEPPPAAISSPEGPASEETIRGEQRRRDGAAGDDIVEQLAEWIFSRHPTDGTKPKKRDALLAAIRKSDSGIAAPSKENFYSAYRHVYKTKAGAPPASGWPLGERYQTRLNKEISK